MKRILLVLIASISLNSNSQNKPKNRFLISKEDIGLNNTEMRLNGFYYKDFAKPRSKRDTIYFISPLIFDKSGMSRAYDYIGNSRRKLSYYKKCFLNPGQRLDTILSFFNCYLSNKKKEDMYSIYSIKNKVIRIQRFGDNFFLEEKGIVLNDSTFVIKKRINYIKNTIKNLNHKYKFKSSGLPKKMKPIDRIKVYFK